MPHPQGARTPSQSQIRNSNPMQYTKPMIDHVFLIRKIVPDPLRPQIKLTNPQLLDVMAQVYRDFQDVLLRDLIRQLMSMAGPAWLSLLEEPNREPPPNHSQQMYRGRLLPQAQHDQPPTTQQTKQQTNGSSKGKTLIYRGRTQQVAG